MHLAPNIALMLCTVFVLVVLRSAGDRINNGSLALWIPTLWMLYCASRPLALWSSSYSPDDFRVEDGSPIDRIFLSVLIGLCIVIINNRRLNFFQVLKQNRWLVILCAYMAISALWSDFTAVSFKRWIRFGATPMMAMLVLTEAAPGDAMETIFRRTAYILVPLSLVLIKYVPDLGIQYDAWTGERMWVGAATQKNTLGRLCLLSAFFLIWAIITAWPKRKAPGVMRRIMTDFVVLIVTLFVLRGPGGAASSATSIATLALGIAMYFMLALFRRRGLIVASRVVGIAIMLGIFAGICIPLIGGSGASGLLSLMGRDATFTGRTEIWQAILPVAFQNWVCGVGYGSFWIVPRFSYSLSFMVNESHNGYLEVFSELGIVGLILLVMFLLSFYRDAEKALTYDFRWPSFALCCLLIIVIHNITESSFLRATNHMGAIMIFLAMLVNQLKGGRARAPRPRPLSYEKHVSSAQ